MIWLGSVIVSLLVFLFIGVPLTMATEDKKYEELCLIAMLAAVLLPLTVAVGSIYLLQFCISQMIKKLI